MATPHAKYVNFSKSQMVRCSICTGYTFFGEFDVIWAIFTPLEASECETLGTEAVWSDYGKCSVPVLGHVYLWPTSGVTRLRFTLAGIYRQVLTGRHQGHACEF
jgi:hypothetical protein